MSAPLRLSLDAGALVSNWHWLDRASGTAACGAAVKADGYGLGARDVVIRLADAGCRDVFVATWDEADALGAVPDAVTVSVLHGVREDDMAVALASPARPVLNTREQVIRWKAAGGGLCDVMVDTGMNRLGLTVDDVGGGLLAGLQIETLMSHLASGDDDLAQNGRQRDAFAALKGWTSAQRMSLANSAGICLGSGYTFDLTRPGLALYGGVPRREAVGGIAQVVTPQAQILQRRRVNPGDTVGYNATFTATEAIELAVLNIGYADGYLRGFSGKGSAGKGRFPVIGRVSMDLTIICVNAAPDLKEGDWIDIDYDLRTAARASGLSQYELLTGMGDRFDRVWV